MPPPNAVYGPQDMAQMRADQDTQRQELNKSRLAGVAKDRDIELLKVKETQLEVANP